MAEKATGSGDKPLAEAGTEARNLEKTEFLFLNQCFIFGFK